MAAGDVDGVVDEHVLVGGQPGAGRDAGGRRVHEQVAADQCGGPHLGVKRVAEHRGPTIGDRGVAAGTDLPAVVPKHVVLDRQPGGAVVVDPLAVDGRAPRAEKRVLADDVGGGGEGIKGFQIPTAFSIRYVLAGRYFKNDKWKFWKKWGKKK